MRHLKALDVKALHQIAMEAREVMTPGEIAHARKVARANMLLVAKQREAWRRQCREELADTGRVYPALQTFARLVATRGRS